MTRDAFSTLIAFVASTAISAFLIAWANDMGWQVPTFAVVVNVATLIGFACFSRFFSRKGVEQ